MLKKLSAIFLAILFSLSFVAPVTTFADDSTPASGSEVILSTAKEFCEYFKQDNFNGGYFWPSDECLNLTGDETSLTFDRILRIDNPDHVVLKNLDLAYDMIREPFTIYNSEATLTIDGGHYKVKDCMFSVWYNPNNGEYSKKNVKIISGVFEATGWDLDSPFCFAHEGLEDVSIIEPAFESILEDGSYFADVETGEELVLTLDGDVVDGEHSYSKDRNDKTPTYSINRTTVIIIKNEGRGETEEEPTEEPVEEPVK